MPATRADSRSSAGRISSFGRKKRRRLAPRRSRPHISPSRRGISSTKGRPRRCSVQSSPSSSASAMARRRRSSPNPALSERHQLRLGRVGDGHAPSLSTARLGGSRGGPVAPNNWDLRAFRNLFPGSSEPAVGVPSPHGSSTQSVAIQPDRPAGHPAALGGQDSERFRSRRRGCRGAARTRPESGRHAAADGHDAPLGPGLRAGAVADRHPPRRHRPSDPRRACTDDQTGALPGGLLRRRGHRGRAITGLPRPFRTSASSPRPRRTC